MQEATLDIVEYLPLVHAVQEDAPADVPVFVLDPALQSVQAATLDAMENFPATHAVHAVAPVPVPVSVLDPAAQIKQSDCDVLPFRLW